MRWQTNRQTNRQTNKQTNSPVQPIYFGKFDFVNFPKYLKSYQFWFHWYQICLYICLSWQFGFQQWWCHQVSRFRSKNASQTCDMWVTWTLCFSLSIVIIIFFSLSLLFNTDAIADHYKSLIEMVSAICNGYLITFKKLLQKTIAFHCKHGLTQPPMYLFTSTDTDQQSTGKYEVHWSKQFW